MQRLLMFLLVCLLGTFADPALRADRALAQTDLDLFAEAENDCTTPDIDRVIRGCTLLLSAPSYQDYRRRRKFPIYYNNRGLAHYFKGSYSASLQDYNAALGAFPADPSVLTNRARLHLSMGNVALALEDIDTALLRAPSYALALDTSAHVRQAMGQPDAAMLHYQSAMSHGGARMRRLYQCGLARAGLYKGDLDGNWTPELTEILQTCVRKTDCDPRPEEFCPWRPEFALARLEAPKRTDAELKMLNEHLDAAKTGRKMEPETQQKQAADNEKRRKEADIKKKPFADQMAEMQALLNKIPDKGASRPPIPQISLHEKILHPSTVKCIRQHWQPSDIAVKLRLQFNPDGRLQSDPQIIDLKTTPEFLAAASEIIKAVRACEPVQIPPDKYHLFSNMTLTFPAQTPEERTKRAKEIAIADAIRSCIKKKWKPATSEPVVRLRIALQRDGRLEKDPEILGLKTTPEFLATASSAVKSVRECQPFKLPPEEYDVWKNLVLNLDPRDAR